MSKTTDQSMGVEAMVQNFHWKYNCFCQDFPNQISAKERRLRKRLIKEEVRELLEAMDTGSLAEIAKELADVVYVVVGTAVAYGIPFTRVFKAVHASNLTKSGIEKGKITKGPNYVAPDLEYLNGNDVDR